MNDTDLIPPAGAGSGQVTGGTRGGSAEVPQDAGLLNTKPNTFRPASEDNSVDTAGCLALSAWREAHQRSRRSFRSESGSATVCTR